MPDSDVTPQLTGSSLSVRQRDPTSGRMPLRDTVARRPKNQLAKLIEYKGTNLAVNHREYRITYKMAMWRHLKRYREETALIGFTPISQLSLG